MAEGSEVWLAPGSPAIEESPARVAPFAVDAARSLAEWAAAQHIDTVLILNEALLFDGLADAFRHAGVGCLGAGQAAALIERSKIFAHVMMQALGIACPPWRVYGAVADAVADSERFVYPVVIKTDGPAKRTGVFIAGSAGEAREALAYLRQHEIGTGPVLVERYVQGVEISVSVLAGAPGEMVVWPVAREFNRLDADGTAITHGMGALAPAPVDGTVLDTVVDWLSQLVHALERQGRGFRGWLMTNVILGPRGPELLEFNCHVGDPEIQTMLPVIQAPLSDLLFAAAHGGLGARVDLHRAATMAAATVNLVRPGYPGVSSGSFRIPRALAQCEGISLYETTIDGEGLVSVGGRVMSCTASATGLASATAAARALAADVVGQVPGLSFRSDIDAGAGGVAAPASQP
jgi:phosphoribosylamine--glycine ligase